MPRKKRDGSNIDSSRNDTPPAPALPTSTPQQAAEPQESDQSDQREQSTIAPTAKSRARSFKATLSLPAKGVTLGERNGHDWVIAFAADPGKEIKDQLDAAGFQYRDRKWKVFTHAANRPQVETLAKTLRSQFGDEITINDYPTRQVVVAFDARPSEDVTAQLRDAGFHFRSDFTWNADHSAESQRIARDLIKSLPDQSRSAAAGR